MAPWFTLPNRQSVLSILSLLLVSAGLVVAAPAVLPGTEPLAKGQSGVGNWDGVIDDEIQRATAARSRHWHRDFSSAESYDRSIETNRFRFSQIIGVRDARVPFESPSLLATVDQPALAARGKTYDVHRVRWPAFGDVHAEGLLLEPRGRKPVAGVVAVPDCAQTPEQITGLAPGVAAESQFARRLAESGCRVLVPVLIDRSMEVRGQEGYRAYSRQSMSSREFLFRPAFQLGRHLIGYEVQKILAAVEWLSRDNDSIGVIGYGEGALLGFYSAALDKRIDVAGVSGYFDSRQGIWREPFDRSVFSLLTFFGDAEIATMILPRKLIVEACGGPEVSVVAPGGSRGVARAPELARVQAEIARAHQLTEGLNPPARIELIAKAGGQGSFGSIEMLSHFLGALTRAGNLAPDGGNPETPPSRFDPQVRQRLQMREVDQHNQRLLGESSRVRERFMSKLDSSSIEKHDSTKRPYIEHLRREVLGRIEKPMSAFNAKSRLRYDEEKWFCYEVQLDVYPGANAFGFLVVPKDLKPGERRPVVVCQHGGGGNPDQLVKDDAGAYHSFAARLAEEGFVTFAPSVMFPPPDSLVRKCNSVGLTQYSYIAAMHQQILNWLQTQPFVAGDSIALYGLSWGGKTAMRIPLLVDGYAMTIVSGDFNEWIWKTATTDSDYSYVFQPEPYIFEFDLGSTYGYAEMAALIAPRPFMVERGHFDPVGSDEQVGFEFAKVRHLYSARLKLPENCAIEWFVGGHEINRGETFKFLRRHLGLSPTR
ncbi:MAG: hypothetical protein FJ405_04790 [Verrucomicrobia bacterium]|nr:hypothetical protein [Verrucomicrobiota bacterium]